MKIAPNLRGMGRKLPRVTRAQKLALIFGLNVIIFVLLFIFLINPLLETKKKLAGDFQVVKQELDRMADIRNNMEKYRREYAQMQDMLAQILRQLPETKDIPNLLRSVSAVGTETRVKISYFEPGAIQNKDFYGEFPFKIKYSGSYHNIGYFFDNIRRIERVVDVKNFTLVAKGAPPRIVLEGECLAKSYVYLKEQPKPQKDGKTDGKSGPAPKK
jgi:type IV pilus assembly protein PilO